MPEDQDVQRPPALDVDMGGAPQLEGTDNAPGNPLEAPPPAAPAGPWTPDVMKVLMQGIFAMLAAWRGPHWQYPDVEADPLLDPTAQVFNQTPGLRDLAPEHMAIAVVVTGWGTIVAKRVGWDRQLAAARAQEAKQSVERPTEDNWTGGSPYGPNQLAE
ncbi:hypothetical protein [Sulfobacillus harzensis]|uniref:Uncharacterized protein n=1 Tax=Sulfobacillus harzensis TaxID=2729629 RepID=A0A7Y0L6C5_9FIRM|nr:hypothetical protein [Sulfobacillus harzensis]NMP24040.1 hypothetical protein [Sulfobacillus harzensis]